MNLKRIWFKALGEKASDNPKEADLVGLIRTFIFLTYLITNVMIVYGVMRTHIFPVRNNVECKR